MLDTLILVYLESVQRPLYLDSRFLKKLPDDSTQSPILGTTITVSRLKRRGYESLLDYYQKVSPVFNQYPLEKAGILTF